MGMFPDEGGSSQEPLEGSQDERNLPHRKRSFIQMLMDNPKDTLDHARLDDMGEGYVLFFPSHLIAPYLSNSYFTMLLLLCFLPFFLFPPCGFVPGCLNFEFCYESSYLILLTFVWKQLLSCVCCCLVFSSPPLLLFPGVLKIAVNLHAVNTSTTYLHSCLSNSYCALAAAALISPFLLSCFCSWVVCKLQ